MSYIKKIVNLYKIIMRIDTKSLTTNRGKSVTMHEFGVGSWIFPLFEWIKRKNKGIESSIMRRKVEIYTKTICN